MKKIRFIAALLCLFLVNVIPVSANEEAGQPKVIDEVELLSNEEEAELTEQINAIITQYQTDVVLVIENQIPEADMGAEAKKLRDDNGYGIGDDRHTIMFIFETSTGMCNILQLGYENKFIPENDLRPLFNNVVQNYLSTGQYGAGFKVFLEEIGPLYEKSMNSQTGGQSAGNGDADANESESSQNYQPSNSGTAAGTGKNQQESKTSPKPKTPVSYIIPAMICGLIISFIYMFGMKAKLDTAYKQRDAEVYRNADASVQVQKDEVFLTSSIIKEPLKKK